MLSSKKHAGEPLLVQVPQFESDVAELNRAVSSHPKQMVSVAWHAHIRFLQQPVRDGTQSHQRLLDQLRTKLLYANQFADGSLDRCTILRAKLQFLVGPFREVRKRIMDKAHADGGGISLRELPQPLDFIDATCGAHENSAQRNVKLRAVALAGIRTPRSNAVYRSLRWT